MSLEAIREQRIECAICGRTFEWLNEFKGHLDKRGQVCVGGTPDG